MAVSDFLRPAAGGTGTGQVPFTFLKALPGVKENLSGIAYYPTNDSLMVVRNNPPALFEVSLEGKILKTINLEGFDDTEGITHVEGSRFAITEETKSKIQVVDIPLAPTSPSILSSAQGQGHTSVLPPIRRHP